MDRLDILKQQVTIITNKIVAYQEEIEILDVTRDVLQKEIDLYEPINNNKDELPF